MPGPEQHDDPSRKRDGLAVYASEAVGLLVIAAVILVVILIRYWHYIHWSWR